AALSGITRAGRGSARRSAERPVRPESLLWGKLPVSELVMLLGTVLIFVGLGKGQGQGTDLLTVGAAMVGVGALELTAREHFGAFKPHPFFLAGLAVLALTGLISLVGGTDAARHPLAVAFYAALFGVLATMLRNTYTGARGFRA
ncbi:MAG: hypothetical protein H0V81_13225, partial [Solirubrobacterales bacterium]|nr:hypothetical protein [Solirubrobacterales bacterium]